MGKMLNALILVLGIEFAMQLFPVPTYSSTSLYDFILNPQFWSSSSFYSWFFASMTAIGVGIVVGTIITRQEWVWRAGIVTASFITFGAVLFQMWIFFNAHLLNIGVEAARELIVSILVAPLLLYFIMVSLDFISGKD